MEKLLLLNAEMSARLNRLNDALARHDDESISRSTAEFTRLYGEIIERMEIIEDKLKTD